MRRLAMLLAGPVFMLAMVGPMATPAAAGGGGCHLPRTEGTGNSVDISGICFKQTIVHIGTGGSVTWTNHDEMEHTVTGVGQSFGTYDVVPFEQSVTYRFDQPGTYPYFCLYHPGMIGAVVVGGTPAPSPATATPVAASPVSAVRPLPSDAGPRFLWFATAFSATAFLLVVFYLLVLQRPAKVRTNATV